MRPAIEANQVETLAELGPVPPTVTVPACFVDEIDAAVHILSGGEASYQVRWPDGSVGYLTLSDRDDRGQRLRRVYLIARNELEAAAMAAPAPNTH